MKWARRFEEERKRIKFSISNSLGIGKSLIIIFISSLFAVRKIIKMKPVDTIFNQ